MDFGAMMFSTDYSIRPDDLAKMLEDRGFESMWVPEHTHIPAARTSPWPGGPARRLLWRAGAAALLDAVRSHEAHVAGQVLAAEVAYGPSVDAIHAAGVAVEGHALTLAITRA